MNNKPVAINTLSEGSAFRMYADRRWAHQWGIATRVSVGVSRTTVSYRIEGSAIESEFTVPNLSSIVLR